MSATLIQIFEIGLLEVAIPPHPTKYLQNQAKILMHFGPKTWYSQRSISNQLIFRPPSLGCAFDCFFSFLAVLTMIFGFYASSRIFLVVLKFCQLQKSKKLWPSENQQHTFSKFLDQSQKVGIFEKHRKSRFRDFPKIMIFSKIPTFWDFSTFSRNLEKFWKCMLLIFWRS